jgi:hypothetical protein
MTWKFLFIRFYTRQQLLYCLFTNANLLSINMYYGLLCSSKQQTIRYQFEHQILWLLYFNVSRNYETSTKLN